MDRRLKIFLIVVIAIFVVMMALSLLGGSHLGIIPFMFLFIPLVIPFGGGKGDRREDQGGYCPYCGTPVDPGYDFCTVCGRRL